MNESNIELTSCALVTGASSGIGYEFAIQLANEGKKSLIITARRKDRLEELKGKIEEIWQKKNLKNERKVFIFCCDLSEEKERADLIKRIEHERLQTDILINNAGFGSMGHFSESDLCWEQQMVEVNCKALLHLTRHFLPGMCERFEKNRTRSRIINVSSIASFQSVPYMATYAATKAFVTSLTLAIQAEVKDKGVSLLALCPGPTESEFYKVVGLKKKVEVVPSMTAKEVVAQALESSEKSKALKVNGLKNLVLVQLNRIVPKFGAAVIGERLLRPYLKSKNPPEA